MPRIDLRAFRIFSHVCLQNGSNSNWMDFSASTIARHSNERTFAEREKNETDNREERKAHTKHRQNWYDYWFRGERMQRAIINNKTAFLFLHRIRGVFFYRGIMNRSSACTTRLRFSVVIVFVAALPIRVHSFNWKWSEKIKQTRMVRLNKIAAKTI